jgi:hypothetical protein
MTRPARPVGQWLLASRSAILAAERYTLPSRQERGKCGACRRIGGASRLSPASSMFVPLAVPLPCYIGNAVEPRPSHGRRGEESTDRLGCGLRSGISATATGRLTSTFVRRLDLSGGRCGRTVVGARITACSHRTRAGRLAMTCLAAVATRSCTGHSGLPNGPRRGLPVCPAPATDTGARRSIAWRRLECDGGQVDATFEPMGRKRQAPHQRSRRTRRCRAPQGVDVPAALPGPRSCHLRAIHDATASVSRGLSRSLTVL